MTWLQDLLIRMRPGVTAAARRLCAHGHRGVFLVTLLAALPLALTLRGALRDHLGRAWRPTMPPTA